MDADLCAKRLESAKMILVASGATAILSAIPTPNFEVQRLCAADYVLCANIYYTYFKEDISEEGIIAQLMEAGWAGTTSVGAAWAGAYITVRTTQGAIKEVSNFFGPHAWIASGAVAGATTMAFGAAWTVLVEHLYLARHGVFEESTAYRLVSSTCRFISSVYNDMDPDPFDRALTASIFVSHVIVIGTLLVVGPVAPLPMLAAISIPQSAYLSSKLIRFVREWARS